MGPTGRAGSVSRGPRSVVVAVACLLSGLAILPAPAALAADPAPASGPSPSVPICAERYPADGPGGVDLLLGCIVNEVMHAYLGAGKGTAANPLRLSQVLWPLGVGAALLLALYLVVRRIRYGAGRRLAPYVSTVWWSCPRCRSLNAAGKAICYRCGLRYEDGATEMRADAERPAPQSFGRRDDL